MSLRVLYVPILLGNLFFVAPSAVYLFIVGVTGLAWVLVAMTVAVLLFVVSLAEIAEYLDRRPRVEWVWVYPARGPARRVRSVVTRASSAESGRRSR